MGAVWAVALGVAVAVAAGAPFGLAVEYVTRHSVASVVLATAIAAVAQLRRPGSLLADLKDR